MKNALAADLDHILEHTREGWETMRGARIFMTGGTGFFGCWLLESWAWANERLKLAARCTVLTRDAGAFSRKAPHLAAHPAIELCAGEVRSFAWPQTPFTHVIHAATESSTNLSAADPLTMLDVIVQGTRRTLELARRCGAQKYLLTSSGAVYGAQPPHLSHLDEDFRGAPDLHHPAAAYGEGKRMAELLCALYARQYGLHTTIARGFAFVGPYLPLDAHFAIGNFIRDGLQQAPIRVNGDGTPYRSYLYAADLAIWLWTILWRGAPARAYNVGSEDAVTIGELARTVARQFEPPRPVHIAQAPVAGQLAARYVPSTQRARAELGLVQTIDLATALRRTIEWQQCR